jgi:hypothetical protein
VNQQLLYQSDNNLSLSDHRPNFTLKKSTKRSILHLPGRKQKNTAEDLWLRTNKLTDSPITQREGTLNDTESAPIDVLSTANALMPSAASNQSAIRATANNKPYDHVDTPSRPVARSRNSVDVGAYDTKPIALTHIDFIHLILERQLDVPGYGAKPSDEISQNLVVSGKKGVEIS